MKQTTIVISIALLGLLLLTACGTSSQSNTEQAGVEAESSGGIDAALLDTGLAITPVPGAGGQPLAMQLALGTFRLEDTDYPVDAEQAAALLPLWKAARSLSQSETAATEELQAVIDQIEDTMTAEQLAALADTSLGFEDMGAIAEEFGLEFGGGQFGDISPEMQATMQAARESGQFPPEGFGGPGPGFGGAAPGGGLGPGGGLSPEQRQTAVAERGGFRRAGLGVPSSLLDAVIEFLEAKSK